MDRSVDRSIIVQLVVRLFDPSIDRSIPFRASSVLLISDIALGGANEYEVKKTTSTVQGKMNPLLMNHLRNVLRREQRLKKIKQKRRNALRDVEESMKRLRAEMLEIGEEQRTIREGQRQVREKFEAVEAECQQLKRETRIVLQQSARNKIRLALMFRIFKAREEGDFAKATEFTRLLREMIARENMLMGAQTTDK